MNLSRRSLTVLLLLGCASGSASAQQAFDIALREGLLSIRANDVSLLELSEALTEETGVSFVIAGDSSQKVTTEILDEGFEQAVSQLSPNYMLVRSGADDEVTEVILMLDDATAGGQSEGSFLPTGAPADAVVADDELMDPNVQGQGEQLPGSEGATAQGAGFDANGNPLGPDGLPLGPDGLPVGQDGLPVDAQQNELQPQ